jgi:hypothetical protein
MPCDASLCTARVHEESIYGRETLIGDRNMAERVGFEFGL